MKGKFITLVLTLGFLAAFGVFMHSPPSILDGLTGATPKAKRAAQMAAPLEGNYLFCIHYFMGGIQVDERHRTSMRNLYAAGECCAQYHGANRLGGNSLLGAIYGGQIAAETACRETVSSPNMPCAEESLLPELSPDAQMQMNRILLNALGVVRDAQTLEAGIQEIRKLSGTLPLLGCAMLESALARKESRGAHWRADYPQRNDAVYCKTTVAHWNGQHIAISFESIPERRHDL